MNGAKLLPQLPGAESFPSFNPLMGLLGRSDRGIPMKKIGVLRKRFVLFL
jgi:hypothetical protein